MQLKEQRPANCIDTGAVSSARLGTAEPRTEVSPLTIAKSHTTPPYRVRRVSPWAGIPSQSSGATEVKAMAMALALVRLTS